MTDKPERLPRVEPNAPPVPQPEEEVRGYARYQHLRANVRRRRTGYKLFILFALVVFAGALADIIFLESVAEYGVYAALAILFIWAFILLFSRKRAMEELEELQALERALMQCPDCKSVFQYGQIHFHDHKQGIFSCPVCGVYSRLPKPDAEPVKALAPEGDLKEFAYMCRNCGEEIRVGTFGEAPIHAVRFRQCPNCGEKDFVERVPVGNEAGPVKGPGIQMPGTTAFDQA